ncbi:hypothetical protein HUS70_05615 [Pandoraea nosoerga]|uniref:hypothetical protein n=1 Tax=Pandoraea nosoerga TaxID=2508296 RepID=UPI001581BB87|nr:hypothetical protein [Pandoraea nosoerga]MBN4664905.1 hypothetical protein [Pandoraea nosoerga]MBN4673921.1 hypothetical protein [Pandoraea nosoerga]MBN4680144.1 hypothetical protein [Pandoraea nosoerga]MBN4744144.1 hypothetical protein [Pandoraea nosoerga]
MAHDSTVRPSGFAPTSYATGTSHRFSTSSTSATSRASSLRRLHWLMLPAAAAAALMLTPRAHAQNTPAPTAGATAPSAGGNAPAFNPSADISRAVSRDTTDTAIQNNWNSIMNPAKPKAEEKPAETPRRARRGINTGVSTN